MDTVAFAAMIRACLDDPEDDGPRLIFADWLEEQGDERGSTLRYPGNWRLMPIYIGQVLEWVTDTDSPGYADFGSVSGDDMAGCHKCYKIFVDPLSRYMGSWWCLPCETADKERAETEALQR